MANANNENPDAADVPRPYKNIAIELDVYKEINQFRNGGESWSDAFRRWLEQRKISR